MGQSGGNEKSIYFRDCIILRYEESTVTDLDNVFMSNFQKDDKNQITFAVDEGQEDKPSNKSTTNVLNEGGFMHIFQKRANDDFWKTVNII